MTYRPYPSATRARHQLDRHVHYEDAPRVVRPAVAQFAARLAAAAPPNYERIMANVRAAAIMPRVAYTCPRCSWHTKDVRYEQHNCPGGPRATPAAVSAPALYCAGDRCGDCTPDEECCEATCGCCPRVEEHGNCSLTPGSDDESRYCDEHGEGSLFDRSPAAEARYQLIRLARPEEQP